MVDQLLGEVDLAIEFGGETRDYRRFAEDTYTNALLVIQTKQMNLQAMTQGRETVNAAKVNVRTGLRDAVISVPAGAASGGAVTTVSPGGGSGANVLNACLRKATRLEKLLSSPVATLGGVTANVMAFEGAISYQQIEAARAS